MLAAAGGGMMTTGLIGVAKDISLLREAQANGVTLDPASAEALVTALNNAIASVKLALSEGHRHARATIPLGSTPGAELYAPVYAKVMDDPDQGADAALTNLKEQLQAAVKTVKACVHDMQDTDSGNAHGVSNVADI